MNIIVSILVYRPTKVHILHILTNKRGKFATLTQIMTQRISLLLGETNTIFIIVDGSKPPKTRRSP